MPYEIRQEGDKHCIYNTDTDEKKACHDTEDDAKRQLRLLEAVEHDPGFESHND
jgi:hypothetical protein